MAAEHSSGASLNSSMFCRTCKVGGTQAFKATDEGYESLFHVSVLNVYLCEVLLQVISLRPRYSAESYVRSLRL